MANLYNCYLKWCGDPSETLEDAAHVCITIDADSKEEALKIIENKWSGYVCDVIEQTELSQDELDFFNN